MEHLHRETLALHALGEEVHATDQLHLRGCGECAREVAGLQAVVERARAVTPDDRAVEAPPERVWANIAAATGMEAASGEVEHAGPSSMSDLPRHIGTGATSGAGADADARQPDTGHRPATRSWLLAAAALVTLAVVAGVVLVAGPASEPTGDLLAHTPLEPLDGDEPGEGEARLVAVDDRLRLEVTPGRLPDFDGYYELWLIDTDVERLISLGPLVEDGAHELPPGLDPAIYPIVDVSRETFDGDPTHSGDSVLRGTLAVE